MNGKTLSGSRSKHQYPVMSYSVNLPHVFYDINHV